MSSALERGRTLNPSDVEIAKRWRQQRVQALEAKRASNPLSLTRRERHELSRLGGTRHPAKLIGE